MPPPSQGPPDARPALGIGLAQVAADPDPAENLRQGLSLLGRARGRGATVVCFPELSFTPFFPQAGGDPRAREWAEPVPGPTVERCRAAAREANVAVVLNLCEAGPDGRVYDTCAVIDAAGEYLGKVRMMHLAEMPGFHEQAYFTPGDTPPRVFDLGGARVGVAICYDRHFPEYLRGLVAAGAEVILVPTANTIGEPLDVFEWEMQGTAFQNGVFIALVNRVGRETVNTFAGRSFVVTPQGWLLDRAAEMAEDLKVVPCDLAEVARARRARPYLRDRRPEAYRFLLDPPRADPA